MKIKLLLIIFCFSSIYTSAQISGYMGKKFSILYSPGISMPPSSYTGNFLQNPFFNIGHAASIEYLTRPSIALGLQYRLVSNNINNRIQFENYIGFEDKFKFTSHSFNFYGKFHFNKFLAPLSSYLKMGFGLQELKLKDFIFINDELVNKGSVSSLDFKFNMSIGKNWIIADYLLLGIELEHALPLYSASSYGFSSNSTVKRILVANSRRINNATEFVKLSINIGFIAF